MTTNAAPEVVIEQYSPTTFGAWTDGPKYIVDPAGYADKMNLERVTAVMTAPNSGSLLIELDHFSIGSPVTIYVLNDIELAVVAVTARPDLDIRLLQVLS